jgi:hypothetical protein
MRFSRNPPQTLSQHVVKLAFLPGGNELDDRRAANDELVAIASHGVLRVAQANAIGVPGVPSILCCLDFLQRTGHVEGRKCGPSSDTLAAFVIG